LTIVSAYMTTIAFSPPQFK